MILRHWLLLTAACILMGRAAAAQNGTSGITSTRAGVYTKAQLARGKDTYAGYCRSCHTASTHTGPTFTATWSGRSLSELFGFIRERMPKSAPGSLSDQEYVDVLAYVLNMNKMPSGKKELPADSAEMSSIRIDLGKLSVRKDR